MTDEANAAPAIDAVQPSQIISDTGTDANATGRGVHIPDAEKPKEADKLSTRDAIAKAFDEAETKSKAEADAKAKVAVDDAKAKVVDAEAKEAVKPEKARGDDGKFAKAEPAIEPKAEADKGAADKPATERAAPEDNRQSEGRKYAEPPARFLPEAREKWGPTPYAVKAEMHRISEEVETELRTYRESHEAYEQLREFEELAKQGGTNLKAALQQYVGIENLLRTNPIQGVATVLRNIGITPQQYAQHVMQNPQAHQAQPVAANQQVQQQTDPKVSAIEQELNALKSQLATAQVTPMLERFAADHPDYHALEPQIASVLKSGVIEQLYGAGLSPDQKLTEAYRMVGGRSAPSQPDPGISAENSHAEPPARPVDPDGQKSIKGAPTAGQTGQPQWKPKSNREALERAFASVR